MVSRVSAPRKSTTAPTKKSVGRAPVSRKMIVNGKTTLVPFNPDRATTLLEMNSLSHIEESLAFWYRSLREQACPGCATLHALEVIALPYGIEVVCIRTETERCSYRQEIMFKEVP